MNFLRRLFGIVLGACLFLVVGCQEEMLVPQPESVADNGRRADGSPDLVQAAYSLLTSAQKNQLAAHGIQLDLVHYTGTGYDEKVLRFDSSFTFENAIHALENLPAYTALKSIQTSEGFDSWQDGWNDFLQHWADTVSILDTAGVEAPDPVIADELFAEVLSRTGLVEINGYLIRVDLPNDQVRVISASEPEKIPWLMTSNVCPPEGCGGGGVFDPEVPILECLEKGCLDSYPPMGLQCAVEARGDEDDDHLRISNTERALAVLTYQKAGIWFSITAKTIGQKRVVRFLGIRIWRRAEVGVLGIENCWGWYSLDCNNTQIPINMGEKEDKESKVSYRPRPYRGFRALTAYDVYSIHYCRANWSMPKQYFRYVPGPTAPVPPANPLYIQWH